MTRLPLRLLLGLLVAIVPAAYAQEPAGRDTAAPVASAPEHEVDRIMAEWGAGTPGGVVAVTRGGELVFARGYGEANLEYGIPNTPTTAYHMASVSKQFTAFAIVMLAEAGRLSLDDDVRTHIPELADFGETITLRHLLTHTSGLRDQWTLWAMSGGRMDDVIRQEDLLGLVLRQRQLNFPPGSEYLYSNSGYMLLAEVVERVTGEAFGDWMRANVFEPLGMRATQIYDDHERIVPGRAYSYRGDDDDGYTKAVLSYANAGATSLFTTAEDLARWLRNFRTAEVGGPGALARLQERGVLTDGDTIAYALGIGIGEHRGLRRIQHGGADAGYRTLLAYYPDLDAGVIVLGNSASFNPGRVAEQVAEAFFGEEMASEEEPEVAGEVAAADPAPAVRVPRERLERYTGEYEIEDGPIIRVSVHEEALQAQVADQPPFGLVALSDTLFRVDVPDANSRVAFHSGPDGPVARGTLHQGGATRSFRRIERWTPDPADLVAFVGRYHSPELETVYTVAVEDGALVARHPRHGAIALTPIEEDRFEGARWFFGGVVFERDRAGAVTGMRVTSGRVRNLVFERQG